MGRRPPAKPPPQPGRAGESTRAGAPRRAGVARTIDPARRAACDVLCAVTERGAYANVLLPALLAERGVTGRDAALATELTYGTLRGQGSYDAILAACCDRDLGRLDDAVLEVLRLGTHQLLATRVRPHAAVATSVDLVRRAAGPRPAGLVNAVLRRVARRDLASWLSAVAPDRATDLTGHLAVRYSHPRWIVAALAEALGETLDGEAAGPAQTERALAADATPPVVTLCAVPGLALPGELTAAGAEPARWSPWGAYLPAGDPGRLAAVAAGRAGVQDEASQLAALALAQAEVSGPDRRWLDMCAGPGGKARLLAGLAARRGARLLAADVHAHRARLAGRAIGPAGSAAAVAADGTLPGWQRGAFDRVLADVPCTGLGALRRRPDARWRHAPGDVPRLAALARRLLSAALDSARPGGIVGYVTCSPHLAETRDVVAAVLSERADATLLDAPAMVSQAALADVPELRCAEPHGRCAQFWPHRHGTDAVFLALLRRGAGPATVVTQSGRRR